MKKCRKSQKESVFSTAIWRRSIRSSRLRNQRALSDAKSANQSFLLHLAAMPTSENRTPNANHSFTSSDCATKIIRTCFNKVKSFACSQTKCQLHKEFGFVKNYCGEAKIKQWNEDKVEFSTRWVEIFQHLDSESCDYQEIAKIAEFVLCLPGSTASVERVFSHVNDTWTEGKTRLKVETLKAMISVKVNSKMSCLEFYEFVKTQPKMHRKVASKEKYTVRTQQGTEQIDDDSDSDMEL